MSKIPPLIAVFLRSIGAAGGERALLNLAYGLIEAGLRVDLVLSTAEGLDLWQLPSGVRVINLKSPRVSTSFFKLLAYLQQERPEVLIPYAHFATEIAILSKCFARVPTKVLLTEQIVLSREVRYEEKGIRKCLIPWLVRVFYPLADSIVAISHGVAEDLSKMTGISRKRIEVIYNPVITPQLHELASQPIDHPWLQPGEPPVILGVGRLQVQKDFPTLIRAFAQVRKVETARLVILGWGSELQKLEALVKELGLEEDVAFPGFVSNPYAYMASSSVFVLSSIFEGMANVLVEAMAVGTPVISTDCKSGPAEVLNYGQYGDLVAVGDSEAMAKAILDVLAGHTKRVDLKWLNHFKIKEVTQKYLCTLGLSKLVSA